MNSERELMIVIDVFEDGKRKSRMTCRKRVVGKQDSQAVLKELLNQAGTRNFIELVCASQEEIKEDLKDVPPGELPF